MRPSRVVALFVVGTTLVASRARADEPPKDPPVRVTTLVLKHPNVEDQELAPILRAFDENLKKNPRLDMKDLETRLEEFAQEKPVDQIEAARAALADGQKAMGAMDWKTAITRLQAAVEGLSNVLPYIKKQELADAMCMLGVAYHESADKKEAKKAFERLLVWRNDYTYDTNRFPATPLPVFEEAKKVVDKAKRGSLEIRSEPEGAQAYVDGKYVGVTPAVAEALTVGEHWVTLKKDGFRKAVLAGGVSPKYQQTVTAMLERSSKYLLVEQALTAIDKQMGQERLDDTTDSFKETLLVDHAVFIRATPGPATHQTNIEAFLYDLRTRTKLKVASHLVKRDEATADVREIVTALYTQISYEAELVAPKEAPPPEQKKRKPIYKAWWFWTIIAVGVGGVVAAGVLAPKPKNCGDGNYCPGITF